MEKPTVYFTDFRCPVGTSQLDKLKKLCIAAGIKDIDMDGKFVAIKMHFGELGNLAFLRPNYAKAVADLCKEQGGLPWCRKGLMGADGDQVGSPIGVFPQQKQVGAMGAVHQQFCSVPVADFRQGGNVREDAVVGGGGDADCSALRMSI